VILRCLVEVEIELNEDYCNFKGVMHELNVRPMDSQSPLWLGKKQLVCAFSIAALTFSA
jgi:hypothetical protein